MADRGDRSRVFWRRVVAHFARPGRRHDPTRPRPRRNLPHRYRAFLRLTRPLGPSGRTRAARRSYRVRQDASERDPAPADQSRSLGSDT